MKRRYIVAATVLVVGAVAGLAWYASGTTKDKLSQVRLIKVELGRVSSTIRASGIAQSTRAVQVAAATSGIIKDANAMVGDSVHRGMPLVHIANDQAQMDLRSRALDVQEADAAVALARRQLDAVRRDVEAGGESQRAAQEAQDKLQMETLRAEKLRAALDAARLHLKEYTVASPIEGTVTERLVDPGQFVQAGELVYKLALTQSLEILVKANPSDARSVRAGMAATIAQEDDKAHVIEEKVLRIEPAVHKEGATDYVPVWVGVTGNRLGLLPNEQVDVQFAVSAKPRTLRLPIETLVTKNGRDHVWRVVDGRVHLTPVSLGIQDDHNVEILGGLRQEDTVALADGQVLRDGQAVRGLASEAPR